VDVEYLTTEEVAELCRTSPESVRFWRYSGKGAKSFKCGRRVLYPKAEVELWLAELQAQDETQRRVR
jgi:hypothetical protein